MRSSKYCNAVKMKIAKSEKFQSDGLRPFGLRKILVGAIAAVLLSLLLGQDFLRSIFTRKIAVPERSDHYLLRDIWNFEDIEELLGYVKGIGEYKTTANDLTSAAEHIGEAVRLDKNGRCPFLLVPNSDHTLCILPSRLDVAQHFLKYGGRDCFKETYQSLSNRLQAFAGFIFESLDSPALTKLFKSPQYIQAATASCGGLSVFDPIQLGIIILLPGQSVAMHYDVPWFWGATRFNIPQWLLIAMETSGLFQSVRVRQSQGVAYLHSWFDHQNDGGGFYFYPNGTEGPASVVPAEFNTGLVLDGSVIIHGVDTFRPGAKPPKIVPSSKNVLKYVSNDVWEFRTNDEVVAVYKKSDLRISLVWRSRCFETEEDKQKWADFTDLMNVEDVLNVLIDDMKLKGIIGRDPLTPVDLALKIIDTYVVYPRESCLPNYCLMDKVLPTFLQGLSTSVLSWVCD